MIRLVLHLLSSFWALVTRLSCDKESTFSVCGVHHPPRDFTRVILQKATTPSWHVLSLRAGV